MSKIIIFLLFFCRYMAPVSAQGSVIVAGKMVMGTHGITGVSNDPTLAGASQNKIPTEFAVDSCMRKCAHKVTTITINGETQNLSANRTWAVKTPVLYSGTTNGSGAYTVTFAAPYAAAPAIAAVITNQSATNQYLRVSSISTTGFTINVYSRSTLTVLGIDLLSAAAANVSGATVDVYITER